MPERKTARRARTAAHKGRSSSTQAGEYVREEMEHYKKGKHGSRVKSRKQAVAIGLSKARRSGVKVKPVRGKASAATKRTASPTKRTPAKKSTVSRSSAAKKSRPSSRAAKRKR